MATIDLIDDLMEEFPFPIRHIRTKTLSHRYITGWDKYKIQDKSKFTHTLDLIVTFAVQVNTLTCAQRKYLLYLNVFLLFIFFIKKSTHVPDYDKHL